MALLHAPRELGYVPLSEPLVNVRATLNRLREAGLIAEHQFQTLMNTAASIFYKQRTWRTILSAATLTAGERTHIGGLVRTFRVDQKMLDAVALLKAVEIEADARSKDPTGWEFSHTSYFRALTT